jgi:N-acetylglucosamine kinase-like BadF-type ATPase
LNGIAIISGTGTISLGYALPKKSSENPTGILPDCTLSDEGLLYTRSAGWGPMLGDEGSGYDIGYRILKAATFAIDGRGPKTALVDALIKRLDLDPKLQQLIKWAYDKTTFSWQKIADIAPIAVECAAAGDQVAKDILQDAASGLLNSISSVARKLGFASDEAFPIVFAGGLLSSGSLTPTLKEKIANALPKAIVLMPDVEPVMGAVFLNLTKYNSMK